MSDKHTDNTNNRRRRVAAITGSGKGIGKSIALEFAKAGYCVMINDLEQEAFVILPDLKRGLSVVLFNLVECLHFDSLFWH